METARKQRLADNDSCGNYSDGEAGGRSYPTAVITYVYDTNDKAIEGRTEKPFVNLDSAREYATRHSKGKTVIIRVKPQQPEVSVMRDADQSTNR